MSLRDEISALRSGIAARPHRTLDEASAARNSSPEAHGQKRSGTDDRLDAEKLLKLVNETLDEFSEELDKSPRLTALAALGVGVVVMIGRQLR